MIWQQRRCITTIDTSIYPPKCNLLTEQFPKSLWCNSLSSNPRKPPTHRRGSCMLSTKDPESSMCNTHIHKLTRAPIPRMSKVSETGTKRSKLRKRFHYKTICEFSTWYALYTETNGQTNCYFTRKRRKSVRWCGHRSCAGLAEIECGCVWGFLHCFRLQKASSAGRNEH